MNEENIFTARTITDVLDIIFELRDIQSEPMWFRGQGPFFHLNPGILRKAQFTRDQIGRPFSRNTSGAEMVAPSCWEMMKEFKNASQVVFKKKPQNDIEWMVVMQHYGLPTPLLDWTRDPMIALFFAIDISDQEMQEYVDVYGDVSVELWCVNPAKVNEFSPFNQRRVFNSTDENIQLFLEREDFSTFFPVFFESEKLEERMGIQKGAFSIHGTDFRPLDYIYGAPSDGLLYKIEIHLEHVKKIKEQLTEWGYTRSHFIPNIELEYSSIKEKCLSKFEVYIDNLKLQIERDYANFINKKYGT